MLNVKLNENYILKSDKHNFIICQKVKSESTGKIRYKEIAYYNKLEYVIERVLTQIVKESDCKTLDGILQLLRESILELTNNFENQFKA